jgi:hypothetical protein
MNFLKIDKLEYTILDIGSSERQEVAVPEDGRSRQFSHAQVQHPRRQITGAVNAESLEHYKVDKRGRGIRNHRASIGQGIPEIHMRGSEDCYITFHFSHHRCIISPLAPNLKTAQEKTHLTQYKALGPRHSSVAPWATQV